MRSPLVPSPPNVYETQQKDRDALFVREFLKNEGRDDAAAVTAYRRAGYFNPAYPIAVAAERILSRPDIQAAIAAARPNFKPKVQGERSRDSVLADIDAVFESALEAKDHSAAINAKRLEAQLQGYLQENIQVTHKLDVTELSDDQLLRIINKKASVVDAEFKEVSKPKGIGHLKATDERLDAGTGG